VTRRDLFWSLILGSAANRSALFGATRAQPHFPGTPFHAYSRCLPDYLRGLAQKALDRRNAELAKLTSSAAIEARQKWVRETLWKLIGAPLERTPLNARTTGTLERSGYKVEKVVYESRPNLFVTANLYFPGKGAGPFPAVLFQSGHYDEGKAHPNYQRCCQGLAQLGFVVLAFDPMGQGERVGYPDSSGTHTRLMDVDSEHTVPGKQMLLFGDTASRYQLWDAMRSLDYLTSLPMVDAKRVGSTGHSGGGTLTMLLACADERLAAAAPCMGNTENVAANPFLPPGSTDDAEQDLVNSGPLGFDRWDLFYPFAPKPLLIWPSDRDFYATYSPQYISNGWEEFQKLEGLYATLGKADHVKWADTPLPHSLAYDSRLLIYNWFSRWLKNESTPVREEPPVKPEPFPALYVTESGSVVRSLHSETPFTLNKSRKVERTPMALDSLLGVSRSNPAPSKIIARVQSGKVLVQVLEVESEPRVWLPIWVLTADGSPNDKPIVLVLDTAGAERLWFEPDADSVLKPGSPVICSADIRGIGALTPEYSGGQTGYAAWHHQEEGYAWGSMILGKTLIAQRVTDILAIAGAIRTHVGSPVRIAANGKLTVPALFAAALDPKIDAVYLSGGLVAFRSIVDSETYDHTFANFIPGFLNHTDLPEIAASVAPRRVILAGTVGAKAQTLAAEAVRQAYSQAGGVVVEQDAKWSAERLLTFAIE
jgi:dienelactone hydrolase